MTEPLLLRECPMPGVARLTFNRPDKLNALSTPMIDALDAELADIARDRGVRVLVLRGAGDRAFVAGADIGEYRGGPTEAFIAFQLRGRAVFDRLERMPQPVIAAVDGFALGGGFEIALCADIIVATTRAQFGLPEGRLGLCPGGGGTQRLVRAVGKYAAADMLLAGWRIDGPRARQLGLAADCVAPEQLDDMVMARARACLRVAPRAQAEMKRLLREGYDAPLPTAQSLEQEVLFRLYGSRDAGEGIDAFLDKREPVFTGE
ncbi:MAG: enoyl-CoA hydratase-related protein [Alphaproteobacteria bacterium]